MLLFYDAKILESVYCEGVKPELICMLLLRMCSHESCSCVYRVPGNETVINQLIAEMNKGNFDPGSVTDEWIDIHIATTLLKRFLKQLPDSLIPQCKYQDFIIAGRAPNQEGMVTRLKELIGQLPPANFHTLQRISDNLATIMKHSEINKVSFLNHLSLPLYINYCYYVY